MAAANRKIINTFFDFEKRIMLTGVKPQNSNGERKKGLFCLMLYNLLVALLSRL